MSNEEMDIVKERRFQDLTPEAARSLVPQHYQQLMLDESEVGGQPDSTYLMFAVKEICDSTRSKRDWKKRLIVNEVLADGTKGKVVLITLYQEHVHAFTKLVEESAPSEKMWLIIYNSDICKSFLMERPGWSEWRIVLGYSQNQAHMWLLSEDIPPPTPCQEYIQHLNRIKKDMRSVFNPLKDCLGQKIGKFNSYAVVNELIRGPSQTKMGTQHLMIGMLDPSCPIIEDHPKDLLLQIFASNSDEAKVLLSSVNVRDVVKVREMKVEEYEGSVRAKVYSEHQVTFYSEEDGTIEARKAAPNGIVKNWDEKIVKFLLEWGKKNIMLGVMNESDDSLRPPSTGFSTHIPIRRIKEEQLLELHCQVVKKFYTHRGAERILILRVEDGTQTSCHFIKYDFSSEEEGESWSSMVEPPGSWTVDIVMVTNVDEADNIGVDDYAFLKNVACVRSKDIAADEDTPVFKLLFNHHDSHIRKLSTIDILSKRIKEDIANRSIKRILGKWDSSSNQGLKQHRSSPPKRSPNRIRTHPLSPSTSRAFNSATAESSQTSHLFADSLDNVIRDMPLSSSGKSQLRVHEADDAEVITVSSEEAMWRNSQSLLADSESQCKQSKMIGSPDVSLPSTSWGSCTPSLLPKLCLTEIDGKGSPAAVITTTSTKETTLRYSQSVFGDSQSQTKQRAPDLQLPSTSGVSCPPSLLPRPCLPEVGSRCSPQAEQTSRAKRRLHPSGQEDDEDLNSPKKVQKRETGLKLNKSVARGNESEEPENSLGNKQSPKEVTINEREGSEALNDVEIVEQTNSKGKKRRKNRWKLLSRMPRLSTEITHGAYYTSIKDVMAGEGGEVTCAVPAFVMGIMISSNEQRSVQLPIEEPYQDMIWGICTKCGQNLESRELRRQYGSKVLVKNVLPCNCCMQDCLSLGPRLRRSRRVREKHTDDDDDNGEFGRVVPFIRLTLKLWDSEDDLSILAHLNGDEAAQFFGLTPSFAWLMGGENTVAVSQLVDSLLSIRSPLFFGICRLSHSSFKVKGTKLVRVYRSGDM